MLKKLGKRYALVSDKDHKKVLKWFGSKKPASINVKSNEKRVQYFKNKSKYKKDHGREAPF
jgi:hypothetical protein